MDTKTLKSSHKRVKAAIPVLTAAVSMYGALISFAEAHKEKTADPTKPVILPAASKKVHPLGFALTLVGFATSAVALVLGFLAFIAVMLTADTTVRVGVLVALVALSLWLAEKVAARS